jgi:hypothetical protein
MSCSRSPLALPLDGQLRITDTDLGDLAKASLAWRERDALPQSVPVSVR